MTMNDLTAAALSNIMIHEKLGRKECSIKPVSRVVKRVLDVLKEASYVAGYHVINTTKGDMLKLELIGNINKCGAIKPRYNVTIQTYEKFEKRYLPSKGFGILIVSTTKGMMSHEKAKEMKLGGRLIAYCY
ncbi:30S ribosomal protein S8 [Candidatus Woesearchaeota archaeon]|nr:30S ribosomal protein S8 [Candidatus Woesearchaeota archaeon]